MNSDIKINTKFLHRYIRYRDISEGDLINTLGYTSQTFIQFYNDYTFSEMFYRRLADYLNIPYPKFITRFSV